MLRIIHKQGKSIIGVIIILFLSFNISAFSQTLHPEIPEIQLMGEIYDSFIGIPVKAKVYLLTKDSTVIDSTVCKIIDKSAIYSLNVPKRAGQYIVKATMHGYKDVYRSLNIKPRKRLKRIVTDNLFMKKEGGIFKEQNLKEVTVTATKIKLVSRGDTLIYDATAFVMPGGSMLGDLIRQMPGAKLGSNGNISINGEKIDYLTLNGKNFFKGRNKLMLDNLPYFTVQNIKVYHKEKDFWEMSKKGKDYVMDVNLKKKYLNNALTNAETGAGSKNRWMARVFSLLTNKTTNFIVFGNANNVNQNQQPGKNGDWKQSLLSNGVKTTRQVGLSLETEGKKHNGDNEFNTLVNWSNDNNESHTNSEFFSKDGDIFSNSQSLSKAKDLKFNLSDEYNFRRKISGKVIFKFSYANNKNQASSIDSMFRQSLVNFNQASSLRRSHQFQTTIATHLAKMFPWGDYLLLTLNGGYDFSRPNETFDLQKTRYMDSKQDSLRNYYQNGRSQGYQFGEELDYHFMLKKDWQIIPSVNYEKSLRKQWNYNYRLDRIGKEDFDEVGILPSTAIEWNEAFDAGNSNLYNNMHRIYKDDFSIFKITEKMMVEFGIPLQWEKEQMHYQTHAIDTIANRSTFKIEPYFSYNRYGRNKRSISYQMSVQYPALAGLMPYTNSTDPLFIRINNPRLKKSIYHTLKTSATFHPDSSEAVYWVGLNAYYAHNALGTRTYYNTSTGAFTYMSDNVSKANWNMSVNGGFYDYLDHQRHLLFDLDGNMGFYHSVDFDIVYDDQQGAPLSRVNTTTAAVNTSLKYSLSSFVLEAFGKVYGHFSRSNRVNFENINAFDFQYGGNLQYTIPVLKVGLATDIDMYSRRGYNSAEMNTHELVWNAQLSKSFFKGRMTAKVKAFDILHQLKSKQYIVNSQGRTESWFTCIPNYVMFTIATVFNKKI